MSEFEDFYNAQIKPEEEEQSFEEFAKKKFSNQLAPSPATPTQPSSRPPQGKKNTEILGGSFIGDLAGGAWRDLKGAAVADAKTLGGGFYRAAAGSAKTIDSYAEKISKIIGVPKSGIFQELSSNWDRYGQQLSNEGIQTPLLKEIVSGLGSAGWAVPEFMAFGKAGMPIVGAAKGGAEGGIKGALIGGAEGALAAGALHGAGMLPKSQAIPALGAFGAATTPGGLKEKVSGGATMAALGAFNPSRGTSPLRARDILEPIGEKIVANPTARRLYEKYVNKDVEQDIIQGEAKKAGAVLTADKNPAVLRRLYKGIKGRIISTFENGPYQYNPATKNFDVLGEGVEPIISDYSKRSESIGIKSLKEQKQDLNDFLVATRKAKDLQDKYSPQQIYDANQTLGRLNTKYGNNIDVLNEAGQRIWNYQYNLLKLGVGNVIDHAEFVRIRGANPHHVPFDKILLDIEGKPRESSARTGNTVTNPLKPIKGGTEDISDILGNLKRYTAQWLKHIDDNAIKVANADIAQYVPDKIKLLGPNDHKPDWAVEYKVNGESRWMEVSQGLERSLSNQTPPGAKAIGKILRGAATALRVGATITPEFWMRNLVRDQLDAHLQTNVGFHSLLNVPRAISEILGKSDMYKEFVRSEAPYGGLVGLERASLEKTYSDIMKKPGLLKKLNIIAKAQDISELVETATRFNVYKASRAAGKDPYASAFTAREATTDFARIGSDTSGMNQTIAFFNAGIQGSDRFIRQLKDDPTGTAVRGIASMTIPTIAEYLLNRNDEDYQNLADWDKNLFWHFKAGPLGFVRIPRPFLAGQVFATLPQKFLEYVDKKDPKALGEGLSSLLEAVSPLAGTREKGPLGPAVGLIPTGLKPLIEIMAGPGGFDFFRSRPVIPRSQQGLPAHEQAMPYTSETMKGLSNVADKAGIGISPMKAEHVIKGLTGGSGKYVLDALDLAGGVARAAAGNGKMPNIISEEPSHAVLLRGFLSRPPYEIESEAMNDFYKNMQKIESHKLSRNRSDGPHAVKVMAEHPEISLSKEFSTYANQLRDMKKESDQIAADPRYSPDLKKRKRTEIAREGNRMVRFANAQYEKMLKK